MSFMLVSLARIALLSFLLFETVVFAALVPPANLSYASLNSTAAPLPWPFAPAAGSTFVFTSTCCGYGNFTPDAVSASSAAYGLWTVPCLPSTWPVLAEWGYEFMANTKAPLFPVCANLTLALRPAPPASREQAVGWLAEYWDCRAAAARANAGAPSASPIVSEIGHYMFSGLSVAFPRNGTGAVLSGSEIGENINSINFHVAATRGAARSGAAPWVIDFSSWMAGFITDYTSPGFWGPASSPVGGHSPSLMRRAYYFAFAAGAGALVSEAGAVNFFLGDAGAPPFPLSPLGAAGADFGAWMRSGGAGGGPEAARGVPYAPLALVTPPTAGMGLGWFYSAKSWDTFPLSEPEQRLDGWLRALWPGSFTVERDFNTPRSETSYLVSGPWGELFDVVVADGAGLKAAAPAYRALVFVGGAAPLPADAAAAVADFVAAGGFALLGAEDVGSGASFPPGFLGVTLGGGAEEVEVASARDAQTGWVGGGGGGPPAFCALDDAGKHWFIKAGGDPTKTRGWDGGVRDKCCSESSSACLWFPSAGACAAALPAAPVLCRACPPPPAPADDVGCPRWAPTHAPIALNLTLAALSGATTLLTLNLTNGTVALGASINTFGLGAVAIILAPAANAWADGGLNLTAHFLDRLFNDTAVFSVQSNVSSDGAGGGVALLTNRHPWGWAATVVNNNGVVKQPGEAAVVDPAAGRRVALALRGVPPAALAAAWVSSGGASKTAAEVGAATDGSAAVVVEVEAGGVIIVGFEFKGVT
jgi:hypothetical protein